MFRFAILNGFRGISENPTTLNSFVYFELLLSAVKSSVNATGQVDILSLFHRTWLHNSTCFFLHVFLWITEGFNIMIAGGYILESILGIQTLLADI